VAVNAVSSQNNDALEEQKRRQREEEEKKETDKPTGTDDPASSPKQSPEPSKAAGSDSQANSTNEKNISQTQMPGHSGSTSKTQLESVESSKETSSETREESDPQQEANTNQSLEDLERGLQERIESLVDTIDNNPSKSKAESLRIAEQIASTRGGANYSARALAIDIGNDPQVQKLKDDEKQLNSLRNLESSAQELIEAGKYEEARELLQEASNNPDSLDTILAEKQQRDSQYEQLTQQEQEKQQQSLEYIRTEADKLQEKTKGIESRKAEIKKLEKEALAVKPKSTSRGSRGGQPQKYRELQQAIKNQNIGLGINESEQARDIQRINERERSYQETQTRLNEAAELKAQGKTREALQVLSGESVTLTESLRINLEREEAYADLPKEERDARIYSDRVDERITSFEAQMEQGKELLKSADNLEPEDKQAIETGLQKTHEVLDQLQAAREAFNEAIEKGEFTEIATMKVQVDALTYRAELQDSINQFRESIISSRQIAEQSRSRSNDPNLSSEERQRIIETLEQNSSNEHRAVRELEKALALHDHITDLIDDGNFTEVEKLTSGEVSFEYEQEYGVQSKADELLRREPKLTLEEAHRDIETLKGLMKDTRSNLSILQNKIAKSLTTDTQDLNELNWLSRSLLYGADRIGGGLFDSSIDQNVDRHKELENNAGRTRERLVEYEREAGRLLAEGKVREARDYLRESLAHGQREHSDTVSNLAKHYRDSSGQLERNLDNALETGRKVGIMAVASAATIASLGTASGITVPILVGTASGTAFGFGSEVLVSQTDSNKSIADGLSSATKKLPGDALLSLETAVSSAVGVRTAGGLESLASTGGKKALTQALANSLSKMSPAARAAVTGSASGAAGASTGALKEVVVAVYERQEISNQVRKSLAGQNLSEEEIQAKIQAEYKSKSLDNQSLIRNTTLAIASGAVSGGIGGVGSDITKATPIFNAAGQKVGDVQKSLAYRLGVGLAEEVVNATVATAEVLARGVDPSSPEFADALITNITQSGISKAAAKAGLDKASTYKYEGVRRAADTQPKITVSDKLPKGVDASTTVRYTNDGKPLGPAEVTLSPDLKAAADSGDSSAMARRREEVEAHAKEKPLDPLRKVDGTPREEPLTQEAYSAIRAQRELAMQVKGEALQAHVENKEVSGLKKDTKEALTEMSKEIESGNYEKALEIAQKHGIDQKYLDQYSKDYAHNSDPNRTHLEQTSFSTKTDVETSLIQNLEDNFQEAELYSDLLREGSNQIDIKANGEEINSLVKEQLTEVADTLREFSENSLSINKLRDLYQTLDNLKKQICDIEAYNTDALTHQKALDETDQKIIITQEETHRNNLEALQKITELQGQISSYFADRPTRNEVKEAKLNLMDRNLSDIFSIYAQHRTPDVHEAANNQIFNDRTEGLQSTHQQRQQLQSSLNDNAQGILEESQKLSKASKPLSDENKALLERLHSDQLLESETPVDLFQRATKELGIQDPGKAYTEIVQHLIFDVKNTDLTSNFRDQYNDIRGHGGFADKFESSISELATRLNNGEGNRQVVEDILGKFESDNDKELARIALAELTQFSSSENLNSLRITNTSGNPQLNLGNTLFYSLSEQSLLRVINYFDKKGLIQDGKTTGSTVRIARTNADFKDSVPDFIGAIKRNENIAILADQATMKVLDDNPILLRQLNQTVRSLTGNDLTVVIPRGIEQGNSPLIHRDNLANLTQDAVTRARELQEQNGLSSKEAVTQALHEETLNRLAAMGLKEKNISYMTNENQNKTSAEEIADSMSPYRINQEDIAQHIDKYFRDSISPEKKERLQKALGEFIDRNLRVITPQEFNSMLQTTAANIREYLENTNTSVNDVYFYASGGRMSYGQTQKGSMSVITNLFATEFGIDPSNIIIGNPEQLRSLPADKTVILLDDFSASGDTLIGYTNKVNEHFNGNILLSPMMVTSDAIYNINNTFADNNRIQLSYAELLTRSDDTSFYDSLSPRDREYFDELVGARGYQNPEGQDFSTSNTRPGNNTSVIFPYMSPNNNNSLTSMVFATLFLPKAAIKKNGESIEDYRIK
jgi:hypothetical protein